MVFGSNGNILPPTNRGWRVRSWLQSHINVCSCIFLKKLIHLCPALKYYKKGKKMERIEKSTLYDSSLCQLPETCLL